MSLKNNTLWVFGDSFCAYFDNYIKTIYERGRYKRIKVLGVASSGTYYSILKLSENIHLFKPNDSIMFGATYGNRHYFAGQHFSGEFATNYDHMLGRYTPVSEHLMNSYKDFLTNLWDLNQGDNINDILKYFIRKEIVPNIPVKNFIFFETISSVCRLPDSFNLQPHSSYKAMLTCVTEFHRNYLNNKDKPIKKILTENNGKNHWVLHPEYEDYFWNIYTKLFEPLWLN